MTSDVFSDLQGGIDLFAVAIVFVSEFPELFIGLFTVGEVVLHCVLIFPDNLLIRLRSKQSYLLSI